MSASGTEQDEVLDVKGAAAHLKVSHHTVYKWAEKGKLPCERYGRALRFSRRTLDAWRAQQAHGGGR